MKKSFTINRSTWRFGGYDKYKQFGLTKLLNTQGYMCCLGSISEQCGVPRKDLLNIDYPYDLLSQHHDLVSFLREKPTNSIFANNTFLAQQAANINDNSNISNEERETRLIELFKTEGYTISFTGEYPQI